MTLSGPVDALVVSGIVWGLMEWIARRRGRP